jgi:hypothetical protein
MAPINRQYGIAQSTNVHFEPNTATTEGAKKLANVKTPYMMATLAQTAHSI